MLTKKHLIFTPICLSLLFQEKMLFIKRTMGGQGWGCNKKELGGIYENLHLRGGVNKWKCGKWVAIFPNNWYCPSPSCNKVTQSTSLKNCLSTFNFFPVSFFLLLLCISTENITKLKKILNLSHRLKWNTISQI